MPFQLNTLMIFARIRSIRSQLEEQRMYYERLLTQSHESESHQHVSALEHEKKQLKKANATLAEKTKKLKEELSFVRCA